MRKPTMVGVASLLLGVAASAHFQDHWQQVDVKPIGGASTLAIEDGVEAFE